MKDLALILLLFISFTSFAQKELFECPTTKARIIGDHKSIFSSGSIIPIRQVINSKNQVIGFVVRDVTKSKALQKYGLKNDDRITEICGSSLIKAFDGGYDIPVCCNSKYPAKLTLKVSRSLIENFTIEIPQKEYQKSLNKFISKENNS